MERDIFLGGNIAPKDKRDQTITAPARSYPNVHMSDVAFSMPIYNQADQPACGSHSLAWAQAYLQTLKKNVGQDYSARFGWVELKKIDGYPVEAGTDMRSMFKVAKQSGALDRPLLPNDVYLPLLAYADPTSVTKDMEDKAKVNAIDSYAFLPDVSFEDLKGLIFELKAIIALVDYDKEWYTSPEGYCSDDEKDIMPLRTIKKPPRWHHFVVLHSYDEKYIYFANSFGSNWAKKGHGYFAENFDVNLVALGAMDTASHPNLFIPPRYLFSRQMGQGSVGVEVFNLQQRLIAEKVATFKTPTGFFGPKTKESVINYQRKYGITHTGFVGLQTLNRLNK